MTWDKRIEIPPTLDGYELFLRCKTLPRYRVVGNVVETDTFSYNAVFRDHTGHHFEVDAPHLFDYQRHVVDTALEKRRYAAYLDCGLGKTPILLAWAHAVAENVGRVLILCPLAVLEDIQRDCQRFHGHRMDNLRHESWRNDIAVLNWESVRDPASLGTYGGIVLDEASILKNDSGKIRKWLTALSAPTTYRLTLSATPSPNEQSEYATQAAWLGVVSTPNEFYGRFFRKEGTQWRLKRHAIDAFYSHLRTWCCYIQSPRSLGYTDCRAELTDPPDYREIRTTAADYAPQGVLFAADVGLRESQVVFGRMRADTTQDRFRDACSAVDGRRAIVWCSRNAEQDAFHHALGGHAVSGRTPVERRVEMIDDFRAGRVRTIVTKPSVLGFGVNLPEAEDMLYSGYTFSFEQFYQAVRRSHRFGRSGRLRVHIPVADYERPVWDAIQRKMRRFDADVSRLQNILAAAHHHHGEEE